VFRLREAAYLGGVWSGPGITVIAGDLREFLERLVEAVEGFGDGGHILDLLVPDVRNESPIRIARASTGWPIPYVTGRHQAHAVNLPPPQDPWSDQPNPYSAPQAGHAPPTVQGNHFPPVETPTHYVPYPAPMAGPHGTPPFGTPPFPTPPHGMAPPGRAPRWQPWHKAVLGALGVAILGLCTVVLFAPDPETGLATGPDRSAAAAVRQAATTDQKPTATKKSTRPAPTKPATRRPAATTKPAATRTPSRTPASVHYSTCDAAPGELTREDPGYRAVLDRDGDGIACEASGDDEAPTGTEEPTSGADPRFGTCAKANAAGYGPYTRAADPEYEWYRDSDSDGVVCER
jgi:hypothetical protein